MLKRFDADCINAYGDMQVRDLNLKHVQEGKGASVTARFGKDGTTICDPNRASEGTDKLFQTIYDIALTGTSYPAAFARRIQDSADGYGEMVSIPVTGQGTQFVAEMPRSRGGSSASVFAIAVKASVL